MEWLLANPQISSTFGSLGSFVDDVYLVNDDCLRSLEEIICKLAIEDSALRTFRRAVGFSDNVKNDIVPLLVHAKDTDIIDTTVRLMVNLSVPVECLLPMELSAMSEIGRHTIFELNKLLLTCKEAFVEWKNTKTLIDHMKWILEKDSKLSIENCDSINNCLLLLRNILHVPEINTAGGPGPHPYPSTNNTSFQNQIIWNLFTQSIDKLLIYLMSCPQRAYWASTLAQLIALMYKDQHVGTLQKLLNIWFESTITESSDDNESNTSPQQQCSGESSPLLTSDPTSDSSDNGSGKMPASKSNSPDEANQVTGNSTEFTTQITQIKAIKAHQSTKTEQEISCLAKDPCTTSTSAEDAANPPPTCNDSEEVKICSVSSNVSNGLQASPSSLQIQSETDPSTQDCTDPKSETLDSATADSKSATTAIIKPPPTPPATPSIKPDPKSLPAQDAKVPNQVSQSETSDCGYGTQVEKEIISTSSNEDDSPNTKPVHQKPRQNQKQRLNAANKQRHPVSIQEKKELRRKKLVKRSKSNIINMKGLVHHAPSDDDISHILKEFTVDFLLKGYNYLVKELHVQLLSDLQIQIDTSHFFWLVTYFLKFAAQLELDMEHVHGVLSFKIVSYLTYEGVMLCEQLEQLSREPQLNLVPCLRRIHLVVTAIREFLQALDTYKKSTHLSKEDIENIALLQLQICQTEDLKCLFVLLIRCYNPTVQSKQYLQDLIVTNHILLLLLDSVGETKTDNAVDLMTHMKQFATVEIMYQYGLLLEDFRDNGAFVNDCIFTMMHHVGGDLGQINVLFQPSILKTYSLIWETEYEICDDWSDLIEYVIHKFINTPQPSPLVLTNTLPEISDQFLSGGLLNSWTQEEKNSLQWYYVQCKQSKCLVADIWKLFQENGNLQKSRASIIEQLWELDIITLTQYDELMKVENPDYERNVQTPAFSVASEHSDKLDDEKSTSSMAVDDIQVLRDRLLKENKKNMIVWLQKSLLDCCYVKLKLLGDNLETPDNVNDQKDVIRMEPISYHCIMKKQSIPVVPWNQEHLNVLSYQPFVLLLQKLGFHLAADAKKLFVRIPEFWTADILYNIALKLGPLEESITKFDLKYIRTAVEELQNTHGEPEPDFNLRRITTLIRSNKSNSVDSSTKCRYGPDVSTNWLRVVITSKKTTNADSTHAMNKPRSSKAIDYANVTHPKVEASNGELEEELPAEPHHDDGEKDDDDDNDDDNNDDDDDSDDELDHADGPCLEEHEVVSACDTASVASDLTRMYVSDEEDKHDIIPPIH